MVSILLHFIRVTNVVILWVTFANHSLAVEISSNPSS